MTFRLFDTGSHFYGEHKVIRIPGAEPFDIATSYPAPEPSVSGISGTKTRYWVDFDDVIDYSSLARGQARQHCVERQQQFFFRQGNHYR